MVKLGVAGAPDELYSFPSGAIRQEVSLRAAITKGCRQRCIYHVDPYLQVSKEILRRAFAEEL